MRFQMSNIEDLVHCRTDLVPRSMAPNNINVLKFWVPRTCAGRSVPLRPFVPRSITHSYENTLMVTGKMPVLQAFSCFVVALSAMGVGMSHSNSR